MRFGLVVPTLNAGSQWIKWLEAFGRQTIKPDSSLVIDSSSNDDTVSLAKGSGFDVVVIKKSEFDHGRTRQRGIDYMKNMDFCVFLTQDAIFSDVNSLKSILEPFNDKAVAAVCGRQLPRKEAGPIETHSRLYNYGDCSRISEFGDGNGLKSIFLSNSFAAYRVDALYEVSGFPEDVIFGEDMYVAAKLLKAGYKLAYAADACVYHSHDYTLLQEMKRYFDMGVFHARQPWIRREFGSTESEGYKFVLSELKYLMLISFWRIPEAILRTVFRYVGYKLGSKENRIPLKIKRKLSMNSGYFNDA